MKIQFLFSWRAFTFVFHVLGITSDAKALYKTPLKIGNFTVKLDSCFFGGFFWVIRKFEMHNSS